ncbi:MAG: hypothetical protein IKV28_05915 [Bacteroidales bacterium]|nr:hypothetical protein [Bacteroidales bacterium]
MRIVSLSLLTVLLLLSGITPCWGTSQNDSTQTAKQEMLSKLETFGVLKARVEYDFNAEMYRFAVRNARLGLKGQLSQGVNYQMQAELSNNGTFTILDLYSSIKIIDGLTLTVGQAGHPLFNAYTVSPGSLLFANRPFIGKFFTGSREIGATAKYSFNIQEFPIALEAGIYNGGTINNPRWSNAPSYAGRLTLGSMTGFRSTVKAYRYPLSDVEDYLFWGVDFRYEASNWRLETEWMNRHNYADKLDLSSYYIQGGYAIPCQIGHLFDHLLPAVRWDAMGYDISENGFQINRLTVGLGFGLTKKLFSSIIRIDYELYQIPEEDSAMVAKFFPGENFNDKLTLELLINF